jgi:predicted AlkP superfamily phosphohydrolase/phosphomutase
MNYPTTFDAALDVHLAELCALEQARFELARELFLAEDWDHFFILFSSTDWLGHAATGSFLAGDQGAFAAFLALYRQLDQHVGWLLEADADAVSAVISDHGQCAETHVVRVNALLRELGFVTLVREAAGDRGSAIRVPTALRPFARSHAVRRLARAAKHGLQRFEVELVTPREGEDVDRARSRAFSPTVASYAVHGRGLTDADWERIRSELLALRLDDGRSAFDGVWRSEELYGRDIRPGGPSLVFAPAVGVRPSVQISRPIVDRVPEEGRGAHQRDGIVLAAGGSVAAGSVGRVSLYDLAPTILWLHDSAVPSGGDGRVLFEAFEEGSFDHREVREVDWEESNEAPAAEGDARVVDRLKALGYL